LGSIAYYVRRDALHFLFQYIPESFKSFWAIRILIRIRVAFAIIMIFSGPLQFWTGFRMRYLARSKLAAQKKSRLRVVKIRAHFLYVTVITEEKFATVY